MYYRLLSRLPAKLYYRLKNIIRQAYLFIMVILFVPMSSWAEVSVNSLFTNHMVLQQKADIKIWGTAGSGEKITIKASFLSNDVKSITDAEGNWLIGLHTPSYGGPYQITIEGKSNKIQIADIYLGEVWLASGQSNMQFPLDSTSKGYNGVLNYQEEVRNADYPLIREFLVHAKVARKEQTKLLGTWLQCNPENARKYSGLAYFFAVRLFKELKVPIGIINSSWGGTLISSWMGAKDLELFPQYLPKLKKINEDTVKLDENYPSALYNGMISPLKNYVIKGVIWNQGERNINDPDNYAARFEALISRWRSDFKLPEMPFLFVEIATYNYALRTKEWFWGTPFSLGDLVEQQSKVLHLKNVFMARTGDIGEVKNIHYRNKQDPGKRLSLLALKYFYHQLDGIVNGPDVSNLNYSANKVTISYQNTGTGLKTNGDSVTGFEISEDGVSFYAAKAELAGDTIVLTSAAVNRPKQVRYCFRNTDKINLFNSFGLPALRFKSKLIK